MPKKPARKIRILLGIMGSVMVVVIVHLMITDVFYPLSVSVTTEKNKLREGNPVVTGTIELKNNSYFINNTLFTLYTYNITDNLAFSRYSINADYLQNVYKWNCRFNVQYNSVNKTIGIYDNTQQVSEKLCMTKSAEIQGRLIDCYLNQIEACGDGICKEVCVLKVNEIESTKNSWYCIILSVGDVSENDVLRVKLEIIKRYGIDSALVRN